MATVVNYLLTLGSHCGAFHRGGRSSTNCPRLRRARCSSSSPPMPVEIFTRQTFTISSGFIGERVSDTSAAARLFSVAGRHETHRHELDDITEVTSPPTATRTRNPPPTSCCGSDVGRCIMSCVSFHPAAVL